MWCLSGIYTHWRSTTHLPLRLLPPGRTTLGWRSSTQSLQRHQIKYTKNLPGTQQRVHPQHRHLRRIRARKQPLHRFRLPRHTPQHRTVRLQLRSSHSLPSHRGHPANDITRRHQTQHPTHPNFMQGQLRNESSHERLPAGSCSTAVRFRQQTQWTDCQWMIVSWTIIGSNSSLCIQTQIHEQQPFFFLASLALFFSSAAFRVILASLGALFWDLGLLETGSIS